MESFNTRNEEIKETALITKAEKRELARNKKRKSKEYKTNK